MAPAAKPMPAEPYPASLRRQVEAEHTAPSPRVLSPGLPVQLCACGAVVWSLTDHHDRVVQDRWLVVLTARNQVREQLRRLTDSLARRG
jgi:hypothetical protein